MRKGDAKQLTEPDGIVVVGRRLLVGLEGSVVHADIRPLVRHHILPGGRQNSAR